MEDLISKVAAIENEHKEFFEKRNLNLIQYVSISKKPVMLRFDSGMNNKYSLPAEIREKIEALIMSYYF